MTKQCLSCAGTAADGARFLLCRGGTAMICADCRAEMDRAALSGWRETVHLLSNPRNAARLLRSIQHAREGKVRELVTP